MKKKSEDEDVSLIIFILNVLGLFVIFSALLCIFFDIGSEILAMFVQIFCIFSLFLCVCLPFYLLIKNKRCSK